MPFATYWIELPGFRIEFFRGDGVMAGYARKTVLGPGEILEKAAEFLPQRLGLSRTTGSAHGASYDGEEGSATISVHRHSFYTEVNVQTDQLRTSRMDYEIQLFLNHLPYEAGDRGGPGSGLPGRQG
jgi:hypothetical protein